LQYVTDSVLILVWSRRGTCSCWCCLVVSDAGLIVLVTWIRCISDMMVCCCREEKDKWIRAKYELCEFLPPLPYADIALSQARDVLYIFI